jgi:hypothetical protein
VSIAYDFKSRINGLKYIALRKLSRILKDNIKDRLLYPLSVSSKRRKMPMVIAV